MTQKKEQETQIIRGLFLLQDDISIKRPKVKLPILPQKSPERGRKINYSGDVFHYMWVSGGKIVIINGFVKVLRDQETVGGGLLDGWKLNIP